MRQTESGQCVAPGGAPGGAAGQRGGDGQVLVRRHVVLQAIQMADIGEGAMVILALLADGPGVPEYFAVAGRQQAAQDPQQAGLAAAVGPGDAQQLAFGHGKAGIGKQPALTAHAAQTDGFKHGHDRPVRAVANDGGRSPCDTLSGEFGVWVAWAAPWAAPWTAHRAAQIIGFESWV